MYVSERLAKASAPYAALANGMAAHSLDFDDTFLEAITHASASLRPAPTGANASNAGPKCVCGHGRGLN